MKNPCTLISRLFTPIALGGAFVASNGLAVGITIGAAVAAAMWVWKPQSC